MDRIVERKKMVREILEKVGQIRTKSRFLMRTQYLFDDEHSQYMLYKYGWNNRGRIYGNVAHFEIAEDGKIWVHHDGTSLELVQQLLDRGIPKSEIVIAYKPEYVREELGFAVS